MSETGPDWRIEQPDRTRGVLYPYHWAGGWTSFKQGLSWWNTWLWWLTRRANVDCNLQAAKSLFACIHNPDRPPYVTQFEQDNFSNTWTRSNLRQQNCFNCDSWTGVTYLNAPCINVPALNIESGTQPFQRSFSAFNGKSWQGSNWYVGPFGASLKVWSAVGSDPVSSAYGLGWWLATANGMSAQGSVSLTAGFNTVYIPVIKRELGVFGANDEFRIYFVHSNGTETWVGSGKLAEIPDSVNFTGFNADFLAPSSTPINIEIQSSMVYPVVCYSATNRTIGVKIQNLSNGRRVYYGRPIALSQACSWFSTQ